MRRSLIVASLAIALSSSTILAQSDTKKFEVGAQFTSLTKPDFEARTEPGFGGRFTFNFNESFAIEAESNFFPNHCDSCRDDNGGNITEVLAGVKVGKRFRKFGIFGKARPGFVSFSDGHLETEVIPLPSPQFPIFIFNRSRQTNFAFDVGGVIELYHSRRIFTRFEGGDTLIHYRQRTFNVLSIDPMGNFVVIPFTRPAHTLHNFQFSAGVGFRF